MLRIQFIFLLCFNWIILISASYNAKFGEPCNDYSTTCNIYDNMGCQNGTCMCNTPATVTYRIDKTATCSGINAFIDSISLISPCLCKENQICAVLNKCQCKDASSVMIEKTCFTPVYRNPMESCASSTQDIAHICDYKKFSHCMKSTCVCFNKYYFNSTTKSCELKSTVVNPDGASGYHGRPEDYCVTNSDCFEGLTCLSNYTCSCPSFCNYKKEKGICDCGLVEFRTPQSVIITGVILGILSLIFWGYLLKRTIKKSKEDNSTSQENSVQLTNEVVNEEMNMPSYPDPIHENGFPSSYADKPPSYPEAMLSGPQMPPYPSAPSVPQGAAPYPSDLPAPQGTAPYPSDSVGPYGTFPLVFPGAQDTAPSRTQENTPYPSVSPGPYPYTTSENKDISHLPATSGSTGPVLNLGFFNPSQSSEEQATPNFPIQSETQKPSYPATTIASSAPLGGPFYPLP